MIEMRFLKKVFHGIVNAYFDLEAYMQLKRIRKKIGGRYGSYTEHIEAGNLILFQSITDQSLRELCVKLNKEVHDLFQFAIFSSTNDELLKSMNIDSAEGCNQMLNQIVKTSENIRKRITQKDDVRRMKEEENACNITKQ